MWIFFFYFFGIFILLLTFLFLALYKWKKLWYTTEQQSKSAGVKCRANGELSSGRKDLFSCGLSVASRCKSKGVVLLFAYSSPEL